MKKIKYIAIFLALTSLFVWMAGCAKGKPPTITNISPTEGPEKGGTKIVITGTNFSTKKDKESTVTVGGKSAKEVVVADHTRITAITPPGNVGTVKVVVENPEVENGTASINFTYKDTTPPTVTSTTPTNNAVISDYKDAVKTGITISVIFSEPIKAGTVQMSVDMVTLEDALTKASGTISGTVEGSGTSFTFVADNPIKSARKYTVTVSGAEDDAGNAMEGNYEFSFSVSTPKRIHWYIVQKGDTLQSIAARPDTYDNASRWGWIVEANQDERLIDRDKIIVGQRILIPWGPAWEGK